MVTTQARLPTWPFNSNLHTYPTAATRETSMHHLPWQFQIMAPGPCIIPIHKIEVQEKMVPDAHLLHCTLIAQEA